MNDKAYEDWLLLQKKSVKPYERILVGVAVGLLIISIYYSWTCVCG